MARTKNVQKKCRSQNGRRRGKQRGVSYESPQSPPPSQGGALEMAARLLVPVRGSVADVLASEPTGEELKREERLVLRGCMPSASDRGKRISFKGLRVAACDPIVGPRCPVLRAFPAVLDGELTKATLCHWCGYGGYILVPTR
jgi:hypothetical protein